MLYIQNNELNPVWNEHFQFIVEDASSQKLTVRVYDNEGVQASELIGCAQVPLKVLEPGKVKDVWLKLVKDLEVQRDTKYRGQVRMLQECSFPSYLLLNCSICSGYVEKIDISSFQS